MNEGMFDRGVTVERGKIVEKDGLKYKVESFTRAGVKSRFLRSVSYYANEREGDPATDNKYEYAEGDEVYFFLFADGRGMILGKVEK